ncbi:hypothetical protein BJ546DRAFT_360295 [Cryomyces antarcticus]
MHAGGKIQANAQRQPSTALGTVCVTRNQAWLATEAVHSPSTEPALQPLLPSPHGSNPSLPSVVRDDVSSPIQLVCVFGVQVYTSTRLKGTAIYTMVGAKEWRQSKEDVSLAATLESGFSKASTADILSSDVGFRSIPDLDVSLPLGPARGPLAFSSNAARKRAFLGNDMALATMPCRRTGCHMQTSCRQFSTSNAAGSMPARGGLWRSRKTHRTLTSCLRFGPWHSLACFYPRLPPLPFTRFGTSDNLRRTPRGGLL